MLYIKLTLLTPMMIQMVAAESLVSALLLLLPRLLRIRIQTLLTVRVRSSKIWSIFSTYWSSKYITSWVKLGRFAT